MTAQATADRKTSRLLKILDEATDQELQALMPWICLTMLPRADIGRLSPQMLEYLATLSRLLGVGSQTTGEQMKSALERLHEALPIPPALMQRLIEELSDDPASSASAFSKLLGGDAGARFLQRTQAPPAGAVSAGPLARFQIGVPVKKSP